MRAAIVEEARSWLMTPYVHLGDVKGVGTDCAMLLVRVYATVGAIPATLDPRPYSPEWYLHRDEEIYLSWLQRYAREVDEPGPGDVALYRYGRCASHGAIVVDDELHMVHAYQPHGIVEIVRRDSVVFLDQQGRSRLHSYWSVIE